jgi:AcrR family transcriptional regulator
VPKTGPSDDGGSRPGTLDTAAVRGAALRLFAERGYRATTMSDIGASVGIRGPSLYRHIRSKQDILAEIMRTTMETLLAAQRDALNAEGDVQQRLRRFVEAHVRFHSAHREEAFVGNRELDNLDPQPRKEILGLRRQYENKLRALIEQGVAEGEFRVSSPQLASFAILDMGMGVAAWYRSSGIHSVDEIAYLYADFAVSMLRS